MSLTIIGIACLALLITETSGIMAWIKFKTGFQRLKPIDCAMCLAWWMALIVFIFKGNFIDAPLFAAISSVMTIMLSKAVNS